MPLWRFIVSSVRYRYRWIGTDSRAIQAREIGSAERGRWFRSLDFVAIQS